MEEELSSSGSDDEYRNEYAYSVDELSNSTVSVKVTGVAVNMLIDSGATCNTINTEFRDKLVSKGLVFSPCRRKLHPYNSPPIIIKEMITAKMLLKDSSTSGELLVVDGNAKPLLSRSTAESLGVLRINANYVAGEDEFSDRLVDKFPKLWDGIGCLCGQQLQLHIDRLLQNITEYRFTEGRKWKKRYKTLWMPIS